MVAVPSSLTVMLIWSESASCAAFGVAAVGDVDQAELNEVETGEVTNVGEEAFLGHVGGLSSQPCGNRLENCRGATVNIVRVRDRVEVLVQVVQGHATVGGGFVGEVVVVAVGVVAVEVVNTGFAMGMGVETDVGDGFDDGLDVCQHRLGDDGVFSQREQVGLADDAGFGDFYQGGHGSVDLDLGLGLVADRLQEFAGVLGCGVTDVGIGFHEGVERGGELGRRGQFVVNDDLVGALGALQDGERGTGRGETPRLDHAQPVCETCWLCIAAKVHLVDAVDLLGAELGADKAAGTRVEAKKASYTSTSVVILECVSAHRIYGATEISQICFVEEVLTCHGISPCGWLLVCH